MRRRGASSSEESQRDHRRKRSGGRFWAERDGVTHVIAEVIRAGKALRVAGKAAALVVVREVVGRGQRSAQPIVGGLDLSLPAVPGFVFPAGLRKATGVGLASPVLAAGRLDVASGGALVVGRVVHRNKTLLGETRLGGLPVGAPTALGVGGALVAGLARRQGVGPTGSALFQTRRRGGRATDELREALVDRGEVGAPGGLGSLRALKIIDECRRGHIRGVGCGIETGADELRRQGRQGLAADRLATDKEPLVGATHAAESETADRAGGAAAVGVLGTRGDAILLGAAIGSLQVLHRVGVVDRGEEATGTALGWSGNAREVEAPVRVEFDRFFDAEADGIACRVDGIEATPAGSTGRRARCAGLLFDALPVAVEGADLCGSRAPAPECRRRVVAGQGDGGVRGKGHGNGQAVHGAQVVVVADEPTARGVGTIGGA